MSKELVISANRHETRVGLIEDDQLVEVYFQRTNEYSLAGSVHKGRVTRVLPGMQSAFVDLGLDRDTFLYVSDFLEEHEDVDMVTGDERPPRHERGPDRDRDRDRRPVRTAPVQEAEPAAPAAPPPGEASVVTAAPPAPVSERAPGSEKGSERTAGSDRPEDRDRRGRRSRRRRNRGRGLPESKYASEPGQHPAADVAEIANEEPAAEAPQTSEAGETVPFVLPGESLAKYKGAAPAGREAAEHEATKNAKAALLAVPEVEDREIAEPLEEPGEGEVENEYDEPIHYPPENALPDAPKHGAAAPAAAVGTPAKEAAALPASAPSAQKPATTGVDVEIDAEIADVEIAETESGPAVAPLLDEEEDRDIQEMILSRAEDLEAAEGLDEAGEGIEESEETISEIEAASESGDEAQAAEEAGNAGPMGQAGDQGAQADSGTAAVRERGGRYPHRISRRMRRGRRGGPPENRPPEGRPEARPEVRTDARPESRPEPRSEPRQAASAERTVTQAAPQGGQISISDLLKEGQEIIVQIAKEPLGQKGARITSHIALPGRYVVYMPTLEHMGVSRKISSDEERLRLKRILQSRRPGPVGGFITRTAAEGRTEEEIASDMAFLYNLWQDIRHKAEKRPAPSLLHHDLDIVQRILRDQLADSFKAIWIDSEETYESVLRFVERFQPALVPKVKLYTRETPIFDAFGVTAELEKALRPKVWLKSGGFIVINQTEALVAIDVNTGKYVGKTNRLEDTIVKTNMEAIKEIVRQVRLRDLGGIIVIDFIDMDERKNRQKVMQTLEEAMRADRAPYKILQFNDFGLVAITRKRVKQSLERTLCAPCPHCDGAGYIKSAQTVVNEILTEARKMAASVEGKDMMLRVHPDVGKLLKSHQNKYLEELEEVLRRPVLVKSDPLLHHEKFDLA
jgi:ribonuclease G